MSDPDQRWMARFQKGDVAAFELLVHKFQAPVLSLVRRYLGSRSPGVDDVAQEVFVRVWRAKHTYEPKAKVGTWIYRITVNTCLNEIRRLRADKNRRLVGFSALFGEGGSGEGDDASSGSASRGGTFADPSTRGGPHGAADAGPERLAAGEAAARVRAAVDRLPEQQRLAVVLSRWHGLSYEDVAAAMDTTVPAVKSLLMRARERLRDDLRAFVAQIAGDDAAGADALEAGTESRTRRDDDDGRD